MPDLPPDPLSGVLLDLDDTLVPWQTPLRWQWAWRPRGPLIPERHLRAVVRRQLHRWDRERWRGLVGRAPFPDPESYRRFLAETLTAIADRPLPEEETQAVIDRVLRPGHEAESFPDAAGAIHALEARGASVGVIADLPAESARLALRRAGLSDQMLVMADDDPGPRPPSAAGFRVAADRLGRKCRELLYVGDLFWSDVRAAARAGLWSVLLDRADVAGRVQGHRIRSLAEVNGLLDHPPAELPEAPSNEAGPEAE